MTKVCHMTSAHGPEDVRIFHKECVSLAKAGYEVYLVQRGGSYEKNGVHIVGAGEPPKGRLKRMLSFSKNVYRAALSVDADVYHIHDPELLPWGMKLKKRGKRVIFDSHEDFAADITRKRWIPAPLRRPVSWLYASYAGSRMSKLDAVITVTPHICRNLQASISPSGPRVTMITNYPILSPSFLPPDFGSRKILFPATPRPIWSVYNLVKSLELVEDVTLEICSGPADAEYLERLQSLDGWKKVHLQGWIPHEELARFFAQCACGIALSVPNPGNGNGIGTLGNTKLFEYMEAGLPVVCTPHELWKDIIDRWHCGLLADPENVEEIAAAIQYLLDHPEEARQMGENGRRAAEEEFNWGAEEKKLLALYEEILNEK